MSSTTVENATEIRPFHVDIPEEALAELRRRILATRWPEKETVADQSQGHRSRLRGAPHRQSHSG
jgi:hypothetical protein